MKKCLLAVLTALAIVLGPAYGQSKIDAPQTVRGRGLPTIGPEQVRTCLFLAKEISDLVDRIEVARSRGDNDTYNSTVDPYNSATDRWNAGCTKAYDPADMIRAENDSGMRLCTLTKTPCLSEAERSAILAREAARQGAAPSGSVGLQKTTGRVLKPTSLRPQVKEAEVDSSIVIESALINLDVEAAYAIDRSAAILAKRTAEDVYGKPESDSPLADVSHQVFEETYKREVERAVFAAFDPSGGANAEKIVSWIVSSNRAAQDEVAELLASWAINGGKHPDDYLAYREGFRHAYLRRQQLAGPN
jgi:hypothetical protein